MMKPLKSVFMKTYGKQTRKLSAWLSPEDRKQAFDSSSSTTTLSTDGDVSVFEPATRTTRIRERKTSVASRRGKTSVSRGRAVRPAKRKVPPCVTETSSDEEKSRRPSPLRPQPAKQSKTTRNSRLVSVPGVTMRQKRKQVRESSESEELSVSTGTAHTHSNVHPPSASRFVTRRRRAVAAKPKVLLATSSILNSSDDFASGAFGSSRFPLPARRTTRVPPAYLASSAENSMNAAGAVSFVAAPFREISLNESADHSLGPCSRKPMFCSTPSAAAAAISRRPFPKPSLISDQCSSPPFVTGSLVEVMSAFQEELCLSDKTTSPGSAALPMMLHSEVKLRSSPEEQEPSGDLFKEPNRSSRAESLPSVILLSADDSERFVSASGGLDWLIEALKEKCLSERCTVRLDRLDTHTVTLLCSRTEYSSCLGESASVQQTNEDPPHGSPETNGKSADRLCSVESFESSKHAASATDSRSNSGSSSEDWKRSVEDSSASNQHADSSTEVITGTRSPARGVTEEKAEAAKDKSRMKECSVQLQKCALSPVMVQQLSSLALNANGCENKPEDLACSDDMIETAMASVRQSTNGSGPGAAASALLTAAIKEKCLTDKVFVGVERLTLSQLKEILQTEARALKSATDSSASDEQAKSERRSERDAKNRSNKEKKGGSSTSEDQIASDKDEVAPHRRKKAPKETKRRSTSADRPGTSRKACVSGLSVSRWKNKGSTHAFRTAQTGANRAADCSINELISTHARKQPKEPSATANFSTPVRTNQLNLSSLLADLTPNTQTWSRLKAALSVHRKGMVFQTPRSLRLSVSGSPRRAELADVSQDLFASPFRTPRRLQSHLKDSSSLVACEDADLSDAEKVYAECGQTRPLPWEECILPQRMKKCVKIGEGTFGEVFSTTNAAGDTVALKIIPLEGSEKVNGEDQKTLGEILHEIIISKELSGLKEKQHNRTHGFIGLNDLHCVQGCYPPDFLNAWDAFDKKKGSENDRPDFFEKDQLFIILEFEFGGSDLENSNGALASLGMAKSILHQVTAALAVAEQELRFEHRDLHWGNVLVKTTKQKTGSFLLNGSVHNLETRGVLVRIIDYSLSRLEIDDLTVSCDISNDEELFMGRGDYQFDIYRLMRQENGNDWSTYHPRTNVLWLHYLCSKLLSMKYRGTRGRGAKDTRQELNRFYDNVLQYSSATEALQTCPMFQ